jgi:excisionase family DNA binding protein
MSANESGPVYTPQQVKDRIGRGVSLGTVYKLLRSGELGHYRVGDTYHIPDADLTAFIARAYVPAKHGEAVA